MLAAPPAPPHSEVVGQADRLLRERPILENTYFTALRSGAMSREQFLHTQIQFFFAVRFFSRPMAALMARLPDSTGRLPLIHNLAEEHGAPCDEAPQTLTPGTPLFDPTRAHDRTFLAFLESMGLPRRRVREADESSTVRSFNLGLYGACAAEPTELAFATLGIIEYAFADISAEIGRTVVERGWVEPHDLVHYSLHAEIDRRHAAEFFDSVAPAWNTGGSSQNNVLNGLKLGLHLFDRLYVDLDHDARRAG